MINPSNMNRNETQRIFFNDLKQGTKVLTARECKIEAFEKEKYIRELKVFSVYFLLDPTTNLLKIGKSTDPEKRVKQLQTGCGTQLILLATTNKYLEKDLHYKFRHSKFRGEWFDYTPEIQLFINVHLKNAEELHLKNAEEC